MLGHIPEWVPWRGPGERCPWVTKSMGPGGITASASCNTFCKFNSTALVVGEAFPAPWKAVPQPFALTLHPPKAVEVPRIHLCC